LDNLTLRSPLAPQQFRARKITASLFENILCRGFFRLPHLFKPRLGGLGGSQKAFSLPLNLSVGTAIDYVDDANRERIGTQHG